MGRNKAEVQVCYVPFSSIPVRVDENGLPPDDVTHLDDNSTETCSRFVPSKHQHTQICKQFKCHRDLVTVSVVGEDMNYGQDLYIFGLTATEAGKPVNKCLFLWEITTGNRTERSCYDCGCSSGCKQVIIIINNLVLIIAHL